MAAARLLLRPLHPLLLSLFLLLMGGGTFSPAASVSALALSPSDSSPWRRNITHLPGFSGPLPFALEVGYLEVDAAAGARLFYYFTPSERRPETDPLILWMSGGPGCSSLTGLIYEIGPFTFDYAAYTGGLPPLIHYPYSWTKFSSIIFVDSYVWAGYSYAASDKDYKSRDSKIGRQVLIFLKKWMDDHPEFKSNPLYIAGDSFGGFLVPLVTFAISESNEVAGRQYFNLKGYMAGNPVTNDWIEKIGVLKFQNGMGIVPDDLFELAMKSCRGDPLNPENVQCADSLNTINQLVVDMDGSNILEPYCPDNTMVFPTPGTHRREMLADHADAEPPLLKSDIPFGCRNKGYSLINIWAKNPEVRAALGIHDGSGLNWTRCNLTIPYVRDLHSTIYYHLRLLKKGLYRALIYSGDHDMLIPFTSTLMWIKTLEFPIVDKWRVWHVDGQTAGYTRSYANGLTFATVKGGGHTAPTYKPKECIAMLERWLSGSAL